MQSGHVVVRPDAAPGREIDLYEVVQGLKARDLRTPVVVRFSDILAHRLRHLHDAFAQAIAENDYRNRYAAVFPIKVNQQRLVVEEVYRYGKEFGFGLEVGSKPELLAVMAMTEDSPGPADHLQRLQGLQLHRGGDPRDQARPHHHPGGGELRRAALILKHAETYGVRPQDRRARQARERGRGPLARFGRREDPSSGCSSPRSSSWSACCASATCSTACSSCTAIRAASCRTSGASRTRSTSSRTSTRSSSCMGAGLQYIDVGGGLGVDYDGSGTNFDSSMNYTLNEYASDVVYRIASVCDARDVPHPMIVSESGRAIAAHHSVLVFNTLGVSALDQFQVTGRESEDYRGTRRDAAAGAGTCSTPSARSTSGAWSSATTMR